MWKSYRARVKITFSFGILGVKINNAVKNTKTCGGTMCISRVITYSYTPKSDKLFFLRTEIATFVANQNLDNQRKTHAAISLTWFWFYNIIQ